MEIDLKDCETSAQAITKIGYGDSHELKVRNLDFRVECENLEDLKKCVSIIESYNEFDVKKVNRALEDHTNTLIQSPYNDEIKNPAFTYSIGREGSVVMYIKERFDHVGDFEERMKLIKTETNADELSFDDTGYGKEARFWWD